MERVQIARPQNQTAERSQFDPSAVWCIEGFGLVRSFFGIGVVNDDFNAAVLLTTGGGIVRRNRLGFAEPTSRFDLFRLDAGFGQVAADGFGAVLRKFVVQFIGADRIGVAFDFQRQRAGIPQQDSGQLAQLFARRRFQRRFADVELQVLFFPIIAYALTDEPKETNQPNRRNY